MDERSNGLFVLAFALALALSLLYGAWRDIPGRYRAYEQNQQQIINAQQERTALQQAVARYDQRVKGLEQDPTEIEAEIRKSKDYVREGEVVFRIQQPANLAE